MKKILSRRMGFWLGFGLLALILAGSGGCGGSSGGTGQLSVNLGASDAAAGASGGSAGLAAVSSKAGSPQDVEAVFVTIQEVQVHLSGDGEADDEANDDAEDEANDDADDNDQDMTMADEHADEGEENEDEGEDEEGGGWITVATPNETFNLMDLKNCLLEKLGSAKLPAGRHVTQIRLVLGDHNFIVMGGQEIEIKVPSGSESGLKINPQGPVEIQEDGEVHVTLRINLDKSLVFTGNGKILFKPVVLASIGGETADAFVSGHVTNDADGTALAGVALSAQVTDGSLAAEDQVKVESSTTTDADGAYRMCVAPGTYNIVATMDGFETAAKSATVVGEETATVDFSLKPLTANEGTVGGTATVPDGGTDALIVLSFRQSVDIDGTSAVIEVASVTVANGEAYAVSLPAGEYDVVASTFGKTAVSSHVTVESDTTITLDVVF